MQTFNSFNSLAAVQHTAPLQSQMSVFNAVPRFETVDQMEGVHLRLHGCGEKISALLDDRTIAWDEFPGVRAAVEKASNAAFEASRKALKVYEHAVSQDPNTFQPMKGR